MSDADRTNVRMTCHVTCACGKFHSNTGFGLRESTRTSNSTHAFIVQCVFRSTWINLLTQSVANGNWKRFTQTFGTMFGMSSILFCCSLTTRTMPVDTGWNWKIASEPSTKWKHAMYSSLELSKHSGFLITAALYHVNQPARSMLEQKCVWVSTPTNWYFHSFPSRLHRASSLCTEHIRIACNTPMARSFQNFEFNSPNASVLTR